MDPWGCVAGGLELAGSGCALVLYVRPSLIGRCGHRACRGAPFPRLLTTKGAMRGPCGGDAVATGSAHRCRNPALVTQGAFSTPPSCRLRPRRPFQPYLSLPITFFGDTLIALSWNWKANSSCLLALVAPSNRHTRDHPAPTGASPNSADVPPPR